MQCHAMPDPRTGALFPTARHRTRYLTDLAFKISLDLACSGKVHEIVGRRYVSAFGGRRTVNVSDRGLQSYCGYTIVDFWLTVWNRVILVLLGGKIELDFWHLL